MVCWDDDVLGLLSLCVMLDGIVRLDSVCSVSEEIRVNLFHRVLLCQAPRLTILTVRSKPQLATLSSSNATTSFTIVLPPLFQLLAATPPACSTAAPCANTDALVLPFRSTNRKTPSSAFNQHPLPDGSHACLGTAYELVATPVQIVAARRADSGANSSSRDSDAVAVAAEPEADESAGEVWSPVCTQMYSPDGWRDRERSE